ncbi:MAG: transglutaminaseTgpA domain-containing protein [Bifidobacterium sp.]|uniref:transglutaminaseTgpA domain-containing protein n=1 Tax=Bifidobacterium sp. TaxID=41200 RepID=UPI0039ED79D2
MMNVIRSACRSWRSKVIHRWHAHGSVRPTAGGALVAAVAAALTFFGLMLDDRSLMASSVAAWLIVIASLALVGMQRKLLTSSCIRDPAAAMPDVDGISRMIVLNVSSRMRRLVLPRTVMVGSQWESLDQHGATVERIVGPIPPIRGLYRLNSSVVVWLDPFGIWRMRAILRDVHDEFLVLPDVRTRSMQRTRVLSGFASGNSQAESFNGVRAYMQGDSPRTIAWKYTAHRGELMTRESSREIPATVLVLLDMGDDHLESCIVQALMLCNRSMPSDARIGVSDGRIIAEAGEAANRFLASLQAAGLSDANASGRGTDDIVAHGVTDSARRFHGGEDPGQGDPPIFDESNPALRDFNRLIVLTSSSERSRLETGLRRSVFSDRYEVFHVQPDDKVEHDPQLRLIHAGGGGKDAGGGPRRSDAAKIDSEVAASGRRSSLRDEPFMGVVAHRHDALNSGRRNGTFSGSPQEPSRDLSHDESPAAALPRSGESGDRQVPNGARSMRALRGQARSSAINARIVQLMTVLALWCVFLATLQSVTAVIEVQGAWRWYVAAAFSVLSIEIAIAPSSLSRSLLRTGVDCALFLVSGVLVADMRIYQAHGVWLFEQAQTVTETAADGVRHSVETPSGLSTAWTALADGFNGMYEQYPPVRVDADADALIIMIATLTLMLLRCLMTQVQASPLLAVFPIVAMSFSYLVVGASPQWWVLFAVLLSGLTLLWTTKRPIVPLPGKQTQHHRASRPAEWLGAGGIDVFAPVPTAVCACMAAIAIITTPLSLALAQRVSIGYGDAPGLFSSQTISPLIDLKRNLQGGSAATVFTYTSDRALYMRMSTLGNFNGDAWSFNLNASGNDDYGSSGQTAAGGGIYGSQRDASSSPFSTSSDRLTLLARMASLSVFGGDYLEDDLQSSSIDIKSLSSSFLPVPGIGLRFTGAADSSSWLTRYDGSLFTNDSGSKDGTRYGVSSVYLRPIQKTSDFSEIGEVQEEMKQVLAELTQDVNEIGEGSNGGGGDSSQSSSASSTLNLFRSRLRMLSADDTGEGRRLRQYYGSLPESLPKDAQAVVDRARSQGVSTDGANAEQEIEAMRYLVRYFNTSGFTYSLDAPDGNGRGNMQIIGDFLKTKSGYCIHYASALAVLGRAMGLSTRMVLGYNAGTEKRGTHTVTADQLHAWVETYIDGIGWVPFDVTPASDASSAAEETTPSEASSSSSSTSSVAAAPTASSTSSAQSTSPSESSSGVRDDGRNAGKRSNAGISSRAWLISTLVLAAVIAAIGPSTLRHLQRRRRFRSIQTHPLPDTPATAMVMWQELVATAIDAGLRWTAQATDLDIAETVADAVSRQDDGAAADIRELYGLAAAAAYGGKTPDGTPPTLNELDLRKMIQAVLEVRKRETGLLARCRNVAGWIFPRSLLHPRG